MATISSTLALNDLMSQPLQNIASSLNSVNAGFDRIEGQTMNASGIYEANRALEQTEQAQDEVTESLQESRSAADGLWGKIKGFVAAYAGWELVKQTVAWSDEITNIKARLDAANDGTQSTAEYMQDIYKAAQASHAPFQQTADLVGKLRNNAAEAFGSNAEAIAFAEQLNKQFAIAGASQQGASDATFQLIQALGSGVLRGEELNSVLDQAPNIVRTIADYMGVSMGDVRKLASEGKITADVVKNAILGSAEQTDAAFNKMPLTFSAAWTMAKNTFQTNMLKLQEIISGAINSEQFQGFMDGMTNIVSAIVSMVIPAIQGIAAAVGWVRENWAFLAPVIYGVIGAMMLYKTVMLAQMAIEGISKGIKIATTVAQYAWAAATGTAVAATTAQTAAQWGLNTAMLANPITWIIIAIIALIALIYLVVAAYNKWTGESVSATGIITGAAYALFAYLKNTLAAVWNNLLSLAEFFYNVWTHPTYSVKKLIYSLLETFKGLFMGILKGIDPVANALAKGILWAVNQGIRAINWLSEAMDAIGLGWGQMELMTFKGSVSAAAENKINSMMASVNPGKAPEGYKSFDHLKMNFSDIKEYAKAGYAAGASFAEDPMGKIKAALGLGGDPAINELLNEAKKGNDLAAQTAKNTAPKAEEDYKYLKEIMAGRAVDRLSGTEIRIQMNNNNNVSSDIDLDKMVTALTNKLTSAMDSAAEGVHL